MLNILHVISGLDQGGAEAMLLRLLQKLNRDEFSQAVVSLTTEGVHGQTIRKRGIPLFVLGMGGVSSIPLGLARLVSVMRELRPDVVQTWLFHADFMGLVAGRLIPDARVAWNVRCGALAPGDVPRSTRFLIKVLSKLSSYPDAVVFNSVAGKEAHEAAGYQPRSCSVIPNGFDLEEWRPDWVRRAGFRAEIGMDDEDFLVGMVARYHPMKRHSVFLSAAKRLSTLAPRVNFILAGSGATWDNASLASEINHHGLRERFTLLGPRTDMVHVMAGLDCLVLPSTSEGFPNVIGEAMACGVPCVATNVGDTPLIVGDTGVIVAVDDANALAAGVAEIMALDSEARKRRSDLCRDHIAKNFGMDRAVENYANFYRELNEHRRG